MFCRQSASLPPPSGVTTAPPQNRCAATSAALACVRPQDCGGAPAPAVLVARSLTCHGVRRACLLVYRTAGRRESTRVSGLKAGSCGLARAGEKRCLRLQCTQARAQYELMSLRGCRPGTLRSSALYISSPGSRRRHLPTCPPPLILLFPAAPAPA